MTEPCVDMSLSKKRSNFLFEGYLACKYLIPRRRSLSSALVSLLSVGVVALVVWLILVFLSVTEGIERSWLHKLTALHAPIRLAPTDHYYSSYFYQVDRIASNSRYSLKTIGEKAASELSDPYLTHIDRAVPHNWEQPDRLENGELKDPVKSVYAILTQLKEEIPSLRFQDYEMSGAMLRVEMVRPSHSSSLSQISYLLSTPDQNPHLSSLLIEPLVDTGEVPPVILPKSYRDGGVRVGDRAILSYNAPSAASFQEQRIPAQVSGFYDPGILPLGSRCVMVPVAITRAVQAASHTFNPDSTPANGIFVWVDPIDQTPKTAQLITQRLQEADVAPYWTVATYEEFAFAKDILQQFRSDRTLFLLIAIIILLVASCNIISLLILLVNDKKKEIAVLQSMGASSRSIALIFAICGAALGSIGSLLGVVAAFLTLHNIDGVVACLSALQGHTAFHPALFGTSLPNQLSIPALLFVLIATPLFSLAAAMIPAYKAVRIQPSSILRPE